MSIRLATQFGNADLPLDQSYIAQFTARPNLKALFQADNTTTPPGVVVTGNAVEQWNDRAVKGMYLSTTTADKRALFVAAALGSYPAAVFDGTNDFYGLQNSSWSRANPFTIVVLFKVDAAAAADSMLMSSFTSVSVQTSIQFLNATNKIKFIHGNGAAIEMSYTKGTWALLIASSDGATLRARLNGVDQTPVATDNGGGSETVVLGDLNGLAAAPYKGAISDLHLWQVDLFSDDAASDLELVERYFHEVYGLDVLPFD